MHFQEAGRDTGEEIIAQRDRPSTVDMQQVSVDFDEKTLNLALRSVQFMVVLKTVVTR